MRIEFMQCPKCGSPLEVEPTARSATCTYCGSRLRVTRGASGHPVAVLSDIKDDTAIIAKQTAINHLRNRLRNLLQERGRLEQEGQSRVKAAEATVSTSLREPLELGDMGRTLMFLGALFFVGGVYGISQRALSDVGLICFVAGFAVFCFGSLLCYVGETRYKKKQQRLVSEAQREVREKYDSLIPELDEKARSTQARIAELEADMDRLAREL